MLCSQANVVPSTPHHANQTAFPWKQNSEGSGLWTSHNRETEQRKLDGTFPLGGGQPQTGKALWVYGVRSGFIAVVGCCCGRLKQLRPWEDQLSVFILLTIGKHTDVSGKIRESISVFVCKNVKLIFQPKQQEMKDMRRKLYLHLGKYFTYTRLGMLSVCLDQYLHLSSSLIFILLLVYFFS